MLGFGLSQLLEEIEQLITPVLDQGQIELVDLSYQKSQGGWTLSLYLDKPGGITLQDCEEWSGKVGTLIDGTSLLNHGYVLEVSSPGLERPIRKLKDFQRFSGEKVHVKLFSPINGQKNFHGVLLGADENTIRLNLEDEREVELPRSQVAKCKLNPVIKI
jgi:ribosome maturation factor RimP